MTNLEKREALSKYCDNHYLCDDCVLGGEKTCRCGCGTHFFCKHEDSTFDMSEQEITDAYEKVFGHNEREITAEKRITKAEFDDAVAKAATELAYEPKLEGMAKLVAPITGMLFAHKMSDILFGENNEKEIN